MPHIRPFRSGDEAAVADICLKTADAGADATGVFEDDAIWAEIFVLPYVHRHPDLAFVVEADDGRVVGYIVGAPDTNAFEDWFHDEWWPERGQRWPKPEREQSRQDGTLIYAYSRRGGAEPYAEDYPAHLHIDLLPEVQGQGWGRLLIDDARRRAARARRHGTAPRGIHRQRRRDRVLPPRRVHGDPVA